MAFLPARAASRLDFEQPICFERIGASPFRWCCGLGSDCLGHRCAMPKLFVSRCANGYQRQKLTQKNFGFLRELAHIEVVPPKGDNCHESVRVQTQRVQQERKAVHVDADPLVIRTRAHSSSIQCPRDVRIGATLCPQGIKL